MVVKQLTQSEVMRTSCRIHLPATSSSLVDGLWRNPRVVATWAAASGGAPPPPPRTAAAVRTQQQQQQQQAPPLTREEVAAGLEVVPFRRVGRVVLVSADWQQARFEVSAAGG